MSSLELPHECCRWEGVNYSLPQSNGSILRQTLRQVLLFAAKSLKTNNYQQIIIIMNKKNPKATTSVFSTIRSLSRSLLYSLAIMLSRPYTQVQSLTEWTVSLVPLPAATNTINNIENSHSGLTLVCELSTFLFFCLSGTISPALCWFKQGSQGDPESQAVWVCVCPWVCVHVPVCTHWSACVCVQSQ